MKGGRAQVCDQLPLGKVAFMQQSKQLARDKAVTTHAVLMTSYASALDLSCV